MARQRTCWRWLILLQCPMQQRTKRPKTGGRTRSSPVWKMPATEFESLVRNSSGVGVILNKFGLENKGRNHHTVRKRIQEMAISVSHFNRLNRQKAVQYIADLDSVMTEHSTYSRGHLKKRLLAAQLLRNECYECGLGSIWNDKPIVLRLDHINGNATDNRQNNLRMLCPNCDSQQSTFCGRNNRKRLR